MSIESVESMVLPQRSQLKDKLANAKSLLVRALEDMRRLTFDLRPSTLDDLGLVATIRSYVQTHLEAVGIQGSFESKGLGGRLEPAVEATLFRIIQEAIRNITRHAEAHNVRIQLEAKAGKITALDQDWQDGYKRQMEVYQWLLRQNGYPVSKTGYFVYCNGQKDRAAFDGKLDFEVTLIAYQGDDRWVEPTIFEIHKCLCGKKRYKKCNSVLKKKHEPNR